MDRESLLLTLQEFFASFEPTPYVLALVLGGAIGLERELAGRPAGLRTHILVCLSATMLIAVSRTIQSADVDLGVSGRLVFDPNRMGAGIVTGIGFLGAATVLRSGDLLRGLTTAACIWFVAGLGIVLGTGQYAVATVATAIVLAVLTGVNWAASWIEPRIYRNLIVRTRGRGAEELVSEVRAELMRCKMRVLDIATSKDSAEGSTEIAFYLSLKNELQSPALIERIAALEGVSAASWKLIG